MSENLKESSCKKTKTNGNSDNIEDEQMQELYNNKNDTGNDADDATVTGSNLLPTITYIRLTLKLRFSGNNSGPRCLGLIKEWLNNIQRLSDKFARINVWYESTSTDNPPLTSVGEVPTIQDNNLQSYFPRFYPRNIQAAHDEYVQINLGYSVDDFEDIQKDINPWLQQGGHGMYVNPLQVELPKETGWLCNSHRSMDLSCLTLVMEAQLGFKVGLRWKAIFVGKDVIKNYKKK